MCSLACACACEYNRVSVCLCVNVHLSRIQQKGPAAGHDKTNAALYEPTSILTPQHRREFDVGITRSLYAYGLGFYVGRYRGMAESFLLC